MVPNSLEWGDQLLFYWPKPDATARVPLPASSDKVWPHPSEESLAACNRKWSVQVQSPQEGRNGNEVVQTPVGTSFYSVLVPPEMKHRHFFGPVITSLFQSGLRTWEGKCRDAEEALIFQHHISILLGSFFTMWNFPCRLSSFYIFLLCGPSSLITPH